MSNDTIVYLVAACSGVCGLAVFIAYVCVPAFQSYSRWFERAGALFLTLYVLAGFMMIGVGAAAAVVYFWDEL